jgi:methionyl-tRNA formyltransferase
LLPKHRGPSSINWPIIQGETRTGITIFWPDEALDEGPILLQNEAPIGPHDTLGSLYFDHLFPMGVDAMIEAVDLVREGKAPRVPQDESQATYESWCKKADAEIDWSKPVAEIYNLIRGTDPQPGAWTVVGDNEVQIYDSAIGDRSGASGSVLAVTDHVVEVAASDGSILVKRVRPKGGKKMDAGAFAKEAGLQQGTRLGA